MGCAKVRVVGYIRVSTTMQADEGVSLEAQKLKLKQYADLYDLDLVDIVEDAAIAARYDPQQSYIVTGSLARITKARINCEVRDAISVEIADRLDRGVRKCITGKPATDIEKDRSARA